MTESAHRALTDYIASTLDEDDVLHTARRDAEECKLAIPDPLTGALLTSLAATTSAPPSTGAIAVTPAAGLVGLYLLRGLRANASVTCIDPEVEHQRSARAAFRAAGYPSSRSRFLPSQPLDVMGRLAESSYQLIYADVAPLDLPSLITAAWPLLIPSGVLVLPDVLLDGTLADPTRTDHDTNAARAAAQLLADLDDAVVARLPLGAGLVLATKRAGECDRPSPAR